LLAIASRAFPGRPGYRIRMHRRSPDPIYDLED
jgi:hypothetical protein